MTNKEYIENLCTFINHFKDEIEYDGYGDKIFDIEQAQKDIETFEAAVRALEFYDKAEVVISQLRSDRDRLTDILNNSEHPSCNQIEDNPEYKDMCIKGLERDKTMYLEMLKAYEKELQEHMTEEEYMAFATKVAKTSFFAEVMASPNEEFCNTVLENWDDITREYL